MEILFILLAALSIPAFFGMKHFLKERKTKTQLQALALTYQRLVLEHKLCVEHYEVIGNKVLALDAKAQKLLLVDHDGSSKTEVCIPLIAVSEMCLVRKKNQEGEIAKLYLELKHKREAITYRVSFFDEAVDAPENLLSLSRRATHWKNRIEAHLHSGTRALEQDRAF